MIKKTPNNKYSSHQSFAAASLKVTSQRNRKITKALLMRKLSTFIRIQTIILTETAHKTRKYDEISGATACIRSLRIQCDTIEGTFELAICRCASVRFRFWFGFLCIRWAAVALNALFVIPTTLSLLLFQTEIKDYILWLNPLACSALPLIL